MRLKTIFVMAKILASSNTAPLDCHNLLYYRTTFCPQTNCLHLEPELIELLSAVFVGVRPQGPWIPLWRDLPMCLRLLLLLYLASKRRREGHAWSGEFRGEHTFRCSPRCPLRLLLLNLLLRSRVCSPDNLRDEIFFLPPTESCSTLRWKMYFLSRSTPCAGDPSETQAAGRLFVVCPDVAELLAGMALRNPILSPICLNPDCDEEEALQSEIFLGFCRPRQGL
jgi:hypothetical protein